jgi:hypothetical protein
VFSVTNFGLPGILLLRENFYLPGRSFICNSLILDWSVDEMIGRHRGGAILNGFRIKTHSFGEANPWSVTFRSVS